MWNINSRRSPLVKSADCTTEASAAATRPSYCNQLRFYFYSKRKCRSPAATSAANATNASSTRARGGVRAGERARARARAGARARARARSPQRAASKGTPCEVTARLNQIIVVIVIVFLANCLISSAALLPGAAAAFGAAALHDSEDGGSSSSSSSSDGYSLGRGAPHHQNNRHSNLLGHERFPLNSNNYDGYDNGYYDDDNNNYNDNNNNYNNNNYVDQPRQSVAMHVQRSSQNFKISPKPCSIGRVEGTCMFVWECIKSEGRHVGMCVDSFMFGSCCSHNASDNIVLSETFAYTRPTKPVGIGSVNHKPRPPYFPPRPHLSGMTTIERPHGAGTLVIRPSGPHHQGVLLRPHQQPTKTTATTAAAAAAAAAKPTTTPTTPSKITTITKSTPSPTTTTITTLTIPSPSISVDMQSAASMPATNMWHTSPQTTHHHHHHQQQHQQHQQQHPQHHWQLPTEPNFITKPRPPSWEKPTPLRPKPPKPTKKPIQYDHPVQQQQQQQQQQHQHQQQQQQQQLPQTGAVQITGKPSPTTMKPKPQIFNTKPMKTSTTTTRPYFRPTAGWSSSTAPASSSSSISSSSSHSTSSSTSVATASSSLSSPETSFNSAPSSSMTTQRHTTTTTTTTESPTSAQLSQQQQQQHLITKRPSTWQTSSSTATATAAATTQSAMSTVAMQQQQQQQQQNYHHHHQHHHHHHPPPPPPPQQQTPSTLNLSTMESNEIAESASSSETQLATIKTITAARSECGIPVLQRPETRIVGGKSAPFGRWPWQVSVRRTSFFGFSSTHRCGGALINENWIATAGHCVDDLLISQIRIRVGEYDFSHVQEQLPYIERGVAKKVVHPKYNFFTYEYDLALVKLEQPLEFAPHVSPICLPQTDSLLIGMNATVTGWGRLSEGGTLPSVLQEVSVPIVSNDNCKTMFLRAGRQEFIPDIFLCAGYETGGQDSCQGDSGGPLQVKSQDGRFFLAGIISWGIGCAEANLPGVCTRISKFVPWIMENVT